MAVLFQDQYDAMRKLGTDESYVLSHLACGYDAGQITAGLAKRGDRDTKDDVPTIVERVYGKLGINKLLKPSERWRKAGKIHFDYSEMLRGKLRPRPGNAPLDEDEPERVDDEVIARDAGRLRFNGTKSGREEGAEDEDADSLPAPSAAKPAQQKEERAEVEYDIEELARNIPTLGPPYRKIAKAAIQTLDITEIAIATGLSEATIKLYLGHAAAKLGLEGRLNWQVRLPIIAEAFKLWETNNPESHEDVPPDPDGAPEEVPADAPDDQTAPQERFSLPDEGTVVNLVDPTSIEDVRVSTAAVIKKYREQGYVLEHIVLPVQGGFGTIMYIHVKRTKPE